MMMYSVEWARKAAVWSLAAAVSWSSASLAQAPAAPAPPTANYWVYVGAESADLLQRLRFGPGGFVVEKTIQAGEFLADIEGPHGLQISRDGKWMFVSTGHGNPDGKFWKYALGPDTLVGQPIFVDGLGSTMLDVLLRVTRRDGSSVSTVLRSE
jgi:hypothetical protein